MKIVALIASYKRDAILRDCLAQIIPQVDAVVLVGSSVWAESKGTLQPTYGGSPIEKMIAKELDLIYVDHRNHPLGQKWQAGLNKCREIKADAVLICGSDDLITSGWVEEFRNIYKNEAMLYGTSYWHVYNPVTDELIEVDYITDIRQDPIGAGRIVSKELLDKLDWQIFPTEGGIGCDLYSYNLINRYIKSFWNRVCMGMLLSVKGNWNMLDSWQQLLNSKTLSISWKDAELKKGILGYFPDVDFNKYRS